MDDIFPLEIIFKIISFLDLVDVVRLRRVCKQLRDMTYDASIWRHLYANSPFPRPSGPFPSQSTRFLENTLVQSAQSGKTWTTHPISDVSRTAVRIGPSLLPIIILRGWYLSFEESRQIILRNIDSESFHQVVWESGEHRQISAWAACSITSPEGQRVYVLLSDCPYSQGRLLEFRMDVDSGLLDHCMTFDIPAMNIWPAPHLAADRAPFVYLCGHRLIFDTRTRVFYQFPDKGSKPDPPVVLPTATHIITIFYQHVNQAHAQASLTIKAFTIPPDPSPNHAHLGVLRLTHEETINQCLLPWLPISFIRHSVTSGSTKLRFLARRPNVSLTLFSCVDLILPEPHPGIVLPISTEIQPIFQVEETYTHVWAANVFVHASDDGHARGFFATAARPLGSRYHEIDLSYRYSIFKFTIDATRDKCVAVVGSSLPLGWKHLTGPYLTNAETVFDGVRGRLYSSQLESENQFVVRSSVL